MVCSDAAILWCCRCSPALAVLFASLIHASWRGSSFPFLCPRVCCPGLQTASACCPGLRRCWIKWWTKCRQRTRGMGSGASGGSSSSSAEQAQGCPRGRRLQLPALPGASSRAAASGTGREMSWRRRQPRRRTIRRSTWLMPWTSLRQGRATDHNGAAQHAHAPSIALSDVSTCSFSTGRLQASAGALPGHRHLLSGEAVGAGDLCQPGPD